MEFFPTKDENKFNESSKNKTKMKKNILKATVVAAFALIAGFNVYNSQKAEGMSELALANVEALADSDEGNSDCHYSNGVTNIQLSSSFWHSKLHYYYDCCGNQIKGYDYDEYCK